MWLSSRGRRGSCPDWYRIIQAARYLRLSPIELLQLPAALLDMAEAAMDAEGYAAEYQQSMDV